MNEEERDTNVVTQASLVLLLLLGILLIVFHSQVLEVVDKVLSPPDPRPVIARVDSLSGQVSYKLPKTLVYKEAKPELELRDQDTLTTDAGSKAILTFLSGFSLEVQENSVIVIEQPQQGEDGTMRITFLRGDFKVINEAGQGKIVVTKDKVQQQVRRPRPLQLAMKAPPKPELPPPPPIKTEVIEEIAKPKPKAVEAKPPPKPKETLSDEYITSVVKKQRPFFKHCYENLIRLNPQARGEMMVSFTIAPNGDVVSVRLLESTLKAPQFEQCTISVIERTRFKKFDGDPIIMNYPLSFE